MRLYSREVLVCLLRKVDVVFENNMLLGNIEPFSIDEPRVNILVIDVINIGYNRFIKICFAKLIS